VEQVLVELVDVVEQPVVVAEVELVLDVPKFL
jgi:hypothetical protein